MADRLDLIARTAFAEGMRTSFLLVAGLGALGFLAALLFIGGRLRMGRRRVEERHGPPPLARFHHRAYHWGKIRLADKTW
jgi:hypothetical protein